MRSVWHAKQFVAPKRHITGLKFCAQRTCTRMSADGGAPKRRKVAPVAGQAAGNGDLEASHTVGSTFKVPGLLITNHHFKVPLDHSGKVSGEIDLFVRELASPNASRRSQSYLLYLQGATPADYACCCHGNHARRCAAAAASDDSGAHPAAMCVKPACHEAYMCRRGNCIKQCLER